MSNCPKPSRSCPFFGQLDTWTNKIHQKFHQKIWTIIMRMLVDSPIIKETLNWNQQ